MESEEITKLVDGVYKNILEKFNPGARQLISAGKGYLKALHGAASASRLFNEALAKIAMNAQQSGTSDIGAALLNVVSVYKEIQEQQMNILKAFYVDLLVPLETNLEKDTKVVQHEQKKFLQQHKVRMESYHKAMTTMKKQRKKKSSPENTEKELRSLQILEDQKKKLDGFCEQSYKNAMTQERRRYGFVLERQCSIAKHWIAYHATGKAAIDNNLDGWQEVAASREVIPPTAYETNYSKRMERHKDDIGHSGQTQLKKARSVDAPYGDMRTLHEDNNYNHHNNNSSYSQASLPRAKSDFNLPTAAVAHENWDQRPVVRALYAYMPSGENQLPFDEGDKIALVGNKAKGWQFGENIRTQMFGWFPIAYTNAESPNGVEKKTSSSEQSTSYENVQFQRGAAVRSYNDYMTDTLQDQAIESDSTYRRRNNSAEESSPTRMFGDTMNLRHQKKYRGTSGANPRPGPPPTLPAPIPAAAHSQRVLNTSQSFCAPNDGPLVERRTHKGQSGPQAAHNRFLTNKKQPALNHMNSAGGKQPAAKTSLHSSNDSGFANEPPPQPEVDYSDEEQSSRVPIRRRADTNAHRPREVTSWTLNRNFRNSIDSHIDDNRHQRIEDNKRNSMRYDGMMIASDDEILQASGSGIKRTKSFWKFGRNEDILAGMSLWQHRDLVVAPNVDEMRQDEELRKSEQHDDNDEYEQHADKNGTLTKSNSNSNHSNSSLEKQRKESVTSLELYEEEEEDENIYGMTTTLKKPAAQQQPLQQQQLQQQQQQRPAMRSSYTPKSRMKIMKTIEIDIENPTENERLSTIKRGQKEYQKEYRETAMLQQAAARNAREVEANNRKPQAQYEQRSQATNLKKSQQDHSKSGNKPKMSQHHQQSQSQPQHQQQTQQRSNPMDLLHSTEDEGESDDNGTLKMSDVNNFFDDLPHDASVGNGGMGGGGMIMKTVKRKDILKQYYTSEDETDADEIKSTSSDPYDCIVINDHLVRKDEKQRRQIHHNASYQEEHQMEFQTFRSTTAPQSKGKQKSAAQNGHAMQKQQHQEQREQREQREQEHYNGGGNSSTLTRNSAGNSTLSTPTATILPRTRLMKSSNTTSMTLERKQQKVRENGGGSAGAGGGSDKERHFSKTYGPWYDFWDPQQQHTLVSQKSGNNTKMK